MTDTPTHWIVFGSKKRPLMGGAKYLDWSQPPIGVYPADNPTDACKAAAQDSEAMGTFVAVPCYPWGLELMNPGARALGSTPSAADKMDEFLNRQAERENQIMSLADRLMKRQLEQGGGSDGG